MQDVVHGLYLRAWVIFLHVYVYICVPLAWWVPGEPEEGIRYPDTGVKESYELLWKAMESYELSKER